MKFKEWLNKVIESGNLCGNYQHKALEAKSKLHLMDIVLDANGASYLCEMQAIGLPLPYETIHKEFGNYINGKYRADFRNEKGNGYSSKIYCCYDSDKIVIDTTCTTILGYKGNIEIKNNAFVQLYIDMNCDVDISCPESSRVIVDYWQGANVSISNYGGKVELNEHKLKEDGK